MNQALHDTLLEFEQLLFRVNPALCARLRPGVPESVVREKFAAIGLPASEELVALYAWHDGTTYEDIPGGQNQFCPEGVFMPLDGIIVDYADATTASGDEPIIYKPAFFPITNSDALLYDTDDTNMVHFYSPSLIIIEPVSAYDSLTHFFNTLMMAINRKIISYNNNLFLDVKTEDYAHLAKKVNPNSELWDYYV